VVGKRASKARAEKGGFSKGKYGTKTCGKQEGLEKQPWKIASIWNKAWQKDQTRKAMGGTGCLTSEGSKK